MVRNNGAGRLREHLRAKNAKRSTFPAADQKHRRRASFGSSTLLIPFDPTIFNADFKPPEAAFIEKS